MRRVRGRSGLGHECPQAHGGLLGGEPLLDDPVGHAAEHLGPAAAEEVGDDGVTRQSGHRGFDRRAGEGPLAGQALEQDEAERVDVAGRSDRFAQRLLGAEVAGGAEQRPRFREVGGIEQPGDAEVGEFGVHAPAGETGRREQHVGRFDVAVDDSLRVHVMQGLAQVGADLGDLRRQHRAVVDPAAKVPPVDELHHDEGAGDALDDGGSGVEQGDQGEVVQARQHGDLAALALRAGVVGGVHAEKLDRHGPPEHDIRRLVDDCHAARSDQTVDAEPVGESNADRAGNARLRQRGPPSRSNG